jgi:hypothetical protein
MTDSIEALVFRRYAARPIRALPLLQARGFALKRYWIDLQAELAPDESEWSPAIALAVDVLPTDVDPARPGVGFLILHRGRGADYLVLGWWARENELPLRVIVRYPGTDDAHWRAARGDESVCVWDLEVIAHERAAYVASFLGGLDHAAARDAYLAIHRAP